MGTRGAYGFLNDHKNLVSYNHYDSYPTGLGESIILYIQNHTDEEMKHTADRVILVSEDSTPTPEQIAACTPFLDLTVSNQSKKDWYCLLRNAQGNLDALETMPYMIDSATFLGDSLFCEYAYIINLDAGKLEFYKGFNKNPEAPGRYAYCPSDRTGYCGVKLMKEWPLAEIRNRSMAEITKEMDTLDGRG